MEFGFFEIFAAGLAGFYAVVKSYGLAIILLTLLVRILLLPLSIKQTRSMREMAVIQPEVKKLQAKHKGNRQKMNEEMMALYKEHGVNPFGGCLPLLMQFPVLIALFYVIRSPLNYLATETSLAEVLRASPLAVNKFLGLRLDCLPSNVLGERGSDFIPGEACGSGLVSFLPYLFLILLMGFTTYYQQRQMQARNVDSPQAQQMQMVGRIMPFLLMVFAYNFPTGVVIYWVTTNLWTIVQQRIILAAAPLPAAAGGAGSAKAKSKEPASGKQTGKAATAKNPPKESRRGKAATAKNPPKESQTGGAKGQKASSAAASKPHPSSKKKKKRR